MGLTSHKSLPFFLLNLLFEFTIFFCKLEDLKMLSNLALRLSGHFKSVGSLLKPTVLQTRCYSDQKIVISEEQPPIPPNLGWVGDENMESVFAMRRIKASFQRGNPPRMRKKFIKGPLVMRLQPITNCSNRRFFRFTITHENYSVGDPYVEDLGSIDPLPNKDNQMLVALNVERIKYYLARGVPLKGLVGHYLGESFYLALYGFYIQKNLTLISFFERFVGTFACSSTVLSDCL